MTPSPVDRYWQCYIGILLMHRKLWGIAGGYDESFIYYGYMEFDFFAPSEEILVGRSRASCSL